MRHIDDGYSYEFYAYEQDVLDYYRKKSDYDTEQNERDFMSISIGVLDQGTESTFSFGTF